ncbi:universal stress protein [Pontibacter arcticus]|uniref:Universal stress protein n=1 Tax=Pontibacter arcticus TaxID=2080288 RepID=A0A364RE36_9BACT|nr:universal stress protein [Pontibacter arcticus]RAU82505.1 universal stress protein [Pontibacter arcticus]
MKKILCPTDFSDTSEKAVAYAVAIAQQAGAHLLLLHVVHLPIVDTSETALVASELLSEQMRFAENKLSAMCSQINSVVGATDSAGFTCDYVVKEALLTDVARHLTKEQGYDLIVMGTTGCDNTVEELLIGSNTEAVMEEVKSPVLSVPTTAVMPPVFRKIIYASDYDQEDKLAIAEVIKLGSLFNADIDVVHVIKEADETIEEKDAAVLNDLHESFPGVPLSFQVVVNKRRDDGLRDYYSKANGNMMVVLRREKGFLKELFSQSLAEKLTYQAEVPLLVLHGKK